MYPIADNHLKGIFPYIRVTLPDVLKTPSAPGIYLFMYNTWMTNKNTFL